MRTLITLSCVLLVVALPCSGDHPDKKEPRKAVFLPGLGNNHHPVSTANAEAQKFFDQGLRLIYAFNHDEALLSFRRAAELDPKLAMAHWGMALAVGPNYNLDAEEAQLKEAYAAIRKSKELAVKAPEHERAYIEALAKRYAADPKKADKKELAMAYAAAMGELAKRYPDDLDAATLYAESMMNLRPWELWTLEGKAAESTPKIVAVLESVLQRDPEHTGANHYYIHAVEASPTPERALPCAERLGKLAPGAGHLMHMPSHIYIRVGDYARAAQVNAQAAEVDRQYIRKFDIRGVYSMMYYNHNLHFLAVAHAIQGHSEEADRAAQQLIDHVNPDVKHMPMLEFFLPTRNLVRVRFGMAKAILDDAAPDASLPIARCIWHYARGRTFLQTSDIPKAEQELAALQKVRQAIPEDMKYGDRNLARSVLLIPEAQLLARIAQARKEFETARAHFEKAINAEDRLNYIEPADWFIPSREGLGRLHLQTGKAAEAEKVFRDDLQRTRRNPRSLYGLRESLKAQGKTYAARLIGQQFEAAWRNASPAALSLDDL